MNGIVVIDKEKGYTSRDVVNIASKIFKTKKIGHTGTLDPIATGVLVLVIGKATKLVDYLTSLEKEYIAKICLGIATDTLDNTGNIEKTEEVFVTEEEIDAILKNMIGTYEQEVPKYAAVKVNGKKLYEYARAGEEVVLPKRSVTIFKLERISNIEKLDGKLYFSIKTTVSKGTYIRSLIRDICHYLKTVGIMTKLTRTSQGQFKLKDTYTLIDINNGNYQIIPIEKAINLPIIQVDDKLKFKIINGQILDGYSKDVLFIDKDNKPLAIYTNKDNKFRPKVMLYEAK